jgi:preprotein translocase subunit SecD
VIAAVPGYNPEGRPSINVTVDDDGGRNLAQFTTAHVGEDIEVRSEGRLLMKARLSTALLGGNIVIISGVGPDENSSLARRLQRDGKIEVEASKRSPQ